MRLILMATVVLAGCAANQGAMLEQSALETLTSAKSPAEVAGCAHQSLNGGPQMGTDGTTYWVTRPNAWGTAVRYDFKPAPQGGTVVEYRSRLRINNGLEKVRACL